MNLENLKTLLIDKGCHRLFIKKLSPNDNSKNQVYLGGNFEILNILPISEIHNEEAGDWNRERFKASMNFNWISSDGATYHAPKSQLILYPKYPEVRFSGFLAKCENPPSEIMTRRIDNRFLFISSNNNGDIFGYVALPNSTLAIEFENAVIDDEIGVFKIIDLKFGGNYKDKLLSELRRIHELNWIDSKKLNRDGSFSPCISSNCGGYTLEAELGIIPNGYAEPDYLGWEIKQFGVTNFEHTQSSVITLMTPEPTNGIYCSDGVDAFIRRYGYKDLRGRVDRLNFGGIYKVGERQPRTTLRMELLGYDFSEGKIRSTSGMIALMDDSDKIAASWSYSSMILHWNRKHNQACYIPSLFQQEPIRKYKFGDRVILGIGTDFQFFLKEMSAGNIYYDPGIKMENASTDPKIKKRSQFRIKSKNLKNLYKTCDTISIY